eukprot:5332506-Pleurochrysis_carterae.AAC.1
MVSLCTCCGYYMHRPGKAVTKQPWRKDRGFKLVRRTELGFAKHLATTTPRSKVELGPIRLLRPCLLEPRTPELACAGYFEILPGSTLGRSSSEPGRNRFVIYDTTKGWLSGSGHRCGGWTRL